LENKIDNVVVLRHNNIHKKDVHMGKQKFSLKKYEKDMTKCYEMSKSGINLGTLSQTEERISSQRINVVLKSIQGPSTGNLCNEAEKCGKKDVLGLCVLHIKDRNMDKCKFCGTNV